MYFQGGKDYSTLKILHRRKRGSELFLAPFYNTSKMQWRPLWWSFFVKVLNVWKPLTFFRKNLHHRALHNFFLLSKVKKFVSNFRCCGDFIWRSADEMTTIWDSVYKNGPFQICARQEKIYLVHYCLQWPIPAGIYQQ